MTTVRVRVHISFAHIVAQFATPPVHALTTQSLDWHVRPYSSVLPLAHEQVRPGTLLAKTVQPAGHEPPDRHAITYTTSPLQTGRGAVATAAGHGAVVTLGLKRRRIDATHRARVVTAP